MQRHSFALEPLEGRALFSVVALLDGEPMTATTALDATLQAATVSDTPLIGAFNVAGTYTQPMIGPGHNPDTGTRWDFTGTGKTKKLGTFTLTGSVTGPGFIASARASGKLLITTARGTITLYLHGPPQTPGTLPSYFSWSIGRGTGAYLHSTGKGIFLVSASDATHKFLFRFNPPT